MKLNVDITRQDYADYNKFHFIKTQFKRTVVVGILAVVVMQFVFYDEKTSVALVAISTITSALAYCAVIYYAIAKTKKIPKDNGTILGPKEYEFTPTEFICTTPNFDTRLKWNSGQKLEQDKNAFYLYVETNAAILIPKRYFQTQAQQQDFAEFITAKIANPQAI